MVDSLDFFDILPERQELLCWGFDARVLGELSGDMYARPVYRAVISSMGALAGSCNRRLRERAFTVWAGDWGKLFWCALPLGMHGGALRLMGGFLSAVPGYRCTETGRIPDIPLVPSFRYQRGVPGLYTDEGGWGVSLVDDDPEYGTGLTLWGRGWIGRDVLRMADAMYRERRRRHGHRKKNR